MHSDFQEYFLTVTPPVLTGGLYIVLGVIIWYFLTARAGLGPLLSFHCVAGLFLISIPFPPYNLAMACFLPAALFHMAWNFPATAGQRMPSRLWISMDGFSALLAISHLLFFAKDPVKAAAFQYVLALYAVAAVGFAVYRWVKAAASDYSDPARIIARGLLTGIGSAWLLSSFALVAIRISGVALHHTVIAPIALLFPLCLLVGVLLAERQQSRWQLVQTKRWRRWAACSPASRTKSIIRSTSFMPTSSCSRNISPYFGKISAIRRERAKRFSRKSMPP